MEGMLPVWRRAVFNCLRRMGGRGDGRGVGIDGFWGGREWRDVIVVVVVVVVGNRPMLTP